MPTYIQLLTLTPEGKERAWRDAQHVRRTEQAMANGDVKMLGIYGVLGQWDFVTIVDAPSNEVVARFSMELGVRVGAHVVTMPAIPVGRMQPELQTEVSGSFTGIAMDIPETRSP